MPTLYSEIPDNLSEIEKFLLSDFEDYKIEIENAGIVIFYDTCAIQHHSALRLQIQTKLFEYIKSQNGVVIVTKCILMELAGDEHHLKNQTVEYIKNIFNCGIKIILFDESDVIKFLNEVYQTNEKLNEILRYAVRSFNIKTSTIEETIKNSQEFKNLVGDGIVPLNKDICNHFFTAVRSNKEHEDNLGEQLIGICLYILLYLPAEPSCKFSIYTDDKGAASIICNKTKSIPCEVTDKRPGIYSSAKIFQNMYDKHFFENENEIQEAISSIYNKSISVLALMEKTDLTTEEHNYTPEKLASLISEKGTIKITF